MLQSDQMAPRSPNYPPVFPSLSTQIGDTVTVCYSQKSFGERHNYEAMCGRMTVFQHSSLQSPTAWKYRVFLSAQSIPIEQLIILGTADHCSRAKNKEENGNKIDGT